MQRFPRRPRSVFTGTLGLIAAVSAMGCGSKGDESSPMSAAEGCLDDRQFFEQRVWQPVLGSICVKCHAPEGQAAEKNAKFLLLPSAYPGFLDANYGAVSEAAKIEYEGRSQILQKPLGKMGHGGGAVIAEGSPEYQALTELLARMKQPVTCAGTKADPFASVELLDAEGTIRKAALHLVGRLPTDAELAKARAEGEASFGPILDAMMSEPAYLDRVKEIWADIFQVGRYDDDGLDLLDGGDWPNREWFNPDKIDDDLFTEEQERQERLTNQAIGAEPLELIAHVVRTDAPFGEILTAPYTMVNPFSAKSYGVFGAVTFASPEDPYEWKPAQLAIKGKDGAPLPLPHAGVLTTPAWLNRFPTTTTNLNRHRARMIYKQFLATDLLNVAERPIDPSSVTSLTPTRDDKYCSVCHKVIDPIAGTFQKWDNEGRFRPDASWPTFMPQPGIGNETIDDVKQYPAAAQWLGQRLAKDPRFVASVVFTVYHALTGHQPLTYPLDTAPDFAAKLGSWRAQDAAFRAAGEAFTSSNQNLKAVFKSLVASPYFRAVNAAEVREGELADVGTGYFLGPELLGRKVKAVLGVPWTRSTTDKTEWLKADYKLLYGGVDFDTITDRLTEVNGIMVNVGRRMANEMACRVASWELAKAPESRLLLKEVEATTRPEDATGAPLADESAKIRRTIQHLHARVLGENLPLEHPEIERTWQLFVKTWRELRDAKSTSLARECQASVDLATGATLPTKIDSDKDFTVRAWMAVMTYLLSDYKFLHE